MPLFRRKPKKQKEEPKKSTRKVTKQQKPSKAAQKITPKKSTRKKSNGVSEVKVGKSKVKVIVPEKEVTGKRVYHVSKRPDGKWAVKFAGGEKAIKLFKTQAEAVEYTKKMSENQDGVMLVHNSKGKNKGRIQ